MNESTPRFADEIKEMLLVEKPINLIHIYIYTMKMML